MDPFPRIDIFVRVSSCSLFNEFPRGPRSLPTKLNCNRERERGSIRICVFEIESKDISYAQAATEANENLSAVFPDRVVIGSVWKIFLRCYLFMLMVLYCMKMPCDWLSVWTSSIIVNLVLYSQVASLVSEVGRTERSQRFTTFIYTYIIYQSANNTF